MRPVPKSSLVTADANTTKGKTTADVLTIN